jgi:hypothetical protein
MEFATMKALVIAACLAVSPALTYAAQAQPTPLSMSALPCADYQRNADGTWTTRRATLVPYPNGIVPMAVNTRIPGGEDTYMGLRLGRMLDEQCNAAGRR